MPEIYFERRPDNNILKNEKLGNFEIIRSKESSLKLNEQIYEGFLFKNELRLENKERDSRLKIIKINEENLPNNFNFNSYEKKINKEFRNFNLEDNRRNRRIDRVIGQLIDRPLPRVVPQIDGAEPRTLKGIASRYFSSLTGFTASAHDYGFPRTMTIEGQEVMFEDDKQGYTEIHFTPDSRVHFDPSKMTDSLAQGIQGVIEMVEAVDKGKFNPAQLFVGVTNINMALVAQRMGFVIVDECRTSDGKINKDLQTYTVVGKLGDIRAKVEEFKTKGIQGKLHQRGQRLLRNMVPQVA